MTLMSPSTKLAQQFSSPDANARDWAEARGILESAEVYWLSTVRPGGRPNVAPLIAVWLDGAMYFATGQGERKARNIAQNPQVTLTTGCNKFEGLDVVVEGEATRVSDDAKLQRIADVYEAKYGEAWKFTVHNGKFYPGSGSVREDDQGGALVFEIVPTTAFGFGKGETYSQTRWRF